MLRVEWIVHKAYDATTVAVIAVAKQVDVETMVGEGIPGPGRKVKYLSRILLRISSSVTLS